ncbi:MAG: hypothetical protein V1895_01285, partial [Parcubacteria group bacterium]
MACSKANKYCGFCGQENQAFDEAELQREFGYKLAENIERHCRTIHNIVISPGISIKFFTVPGNSPIAQ